MSCPDVKSAVTSVRGGGLQQARSMTNRQLVMFFIGKVTSDVGTYLGMIILGVYVFQITGSAVAIGFFVASRMVGAVAGSYTASGLSERIPRKAVLVGADLGRAACVGLLVVAPDDWHTVIVYPLAFVVGWLGALFHVSLIAEIPSFQGHERSHKLNSLFNGGEGIAIVIGGLTSAYVLNILSYREVFLLDALSYTAPALILACISYTQAAEGRQDLPAPQQPGIRGSMRVLRSLSAILPLVVCARFLEAIGSGVHQVGLPVFSAQLDQFNPAFFFGTVMCAWGVGRVVATPVAPLLLSRSLVRSRRHGLEMVFLASTIATLGFFLLLLLSAPTLVLMIAFALLAGVSDAITDTSYNSSLQRIPRRERGKVVGVAYFWERIGMGMGVLSVNWFLSSYSVPSVAVAYYLTIAVILAVSLAYLMAIASRGGSDAPKV